MVDWSGAGRRGMSESAQQRLAALGANLAQRDEASAVESPPLAGTTATSGRHRADQLPGRRRITAAVEDRLPAGARAVAARGTVSGHHVAVLAIVLAGLLALTAWWVISAQARPEPVRGLAPATALPSVSAPVGAGVVVPGAPLDPDGSPATGEANVIVDVAGKVRRPGIVTLPLGARVVDALKAAGGARPSVDLTTLNLARELVDGEQLLVGLAPPPQLPPPSAAVPSGAPPGPVALVDLNTASMAELDTLPGVGPVTAQAILDWRAAYGGFSSVDELLEIDGIGEATLADLRDLVTV